MASRHSLASAYQAAGRLDEAITLYKQNLKDSTRILGRNHRSTHISRIVLAYTFREAGMFGEAIALYKEIFEDYEATLGRNHFKTRTLREKLASLYRAFGLFEEATKLLEKQSASGNAKHDGTDDPDQEAGD